MSQSMNEARIVNPPLYVCTWSVVLLPFFHLETIDTLQCFHYGRVKWIFLPLIAIPSGMEMRQDGNVLIKTIRCTLETLSLGKCHVPNLHCVVFLRVVLFLWCCEVWKLFVWFLVPQSTGKFPFKASAIAFKNFSNLFQIAFLLSNDSKSHKVIFRNEWKVLRETPCTRCIIRQHMLLMSFNIQPYNGKQVKVERENCELEKCDLARVATCEMCVGWTRVETKIP
jgi:hypothetical protein